MRLLPGIVFCCLGLAAHGELYKCEDERGKVNFTDRPCAGDAVDTFDAAELVPINTSAKQEYRQKNKAGNYVTEKYRIDYPDGTSEFVSEREYNAQKKRNEENEVRKQVENDPAKLAAKKTLDCLNDRRALERIQKSHCQDAREEACQRIAGVSSESAYHSRVASLRQRLNQNCGG
jgi:hypothetical protein